MTQTRSTNQSIIQVKELPGLWCIPMSSGATPLEDGREWRDPVGSNNRRFQTAAPDRLSIWRLLALGLFRRPPQGPSHQTRWPSWRCPSFVTTLIQRHGDSDAVVVDHLVLYAAAARAQQLWTRFSLHLFNSVEYLTALQVHQRRKTRSMLGKDPSATGLRPLVVCQDLCFTFDVKVKYCSCHPLQAQPSCASLVLREPCPLSRSVVIWITSFSRSCRLCPG